VNYNLLILSIVLSFSKNKFGVILTVKIFTKLGVILTRAVESACN